MTEDRGPLLFSRLAHDFNNVLGAITGYAELAASEVPEDHPVREQMTQILIAVTRAKELVDQLPGPQPPEEQPHPPPAAQPDASPSEHRFRIMLVDDEEMLRDLGKDQLTRLGYDVTTQSSSLAALELFRADPEGFDLVITDLAMSGMRGDRLTDHLLQIRPGLPVIITTGYADLADADRASLAGAPVLTKPYKIDTLGEAVRRALTGRERP